jgi:hypothetical protein
MGIRALPRSGTISSMRSGSERTIGGLSPAAAALEFAVVWLTVAGVALIGWPEEITDDQWVAFCILLPLIAVVHLVGAERQKHQGSHLSLAPIFAAGLILPPALAAIAIALAFFPESVGSRPRWYIVVFNIANFVGPALLARVVFDALRATSDQDWAFAAVISIAAFITVHYAVLAAMLRLARGVRISETIRLDCILIDTGLVSLGALAAALWEANEALVVLTLAPLALAYRSLAIPGLVEATRIEPKTGLYNMRHFSGVISQELQRAGRFERPIALLMVDVDHCGTSTARMGMSAAIARFATSPTPLSLRRGSTTSPRASAGTSSACSYPRPSSKAPSSSPTASAPWSSRGPGSPGSRSPSASPRTGAAASRPTS